MRHPLLRSLATTFGTPDETSVDVGTDSTDVLDANTRRAYLQLINDSDTTIYVSFSGDAAVNAGTRLNANGGSAVFDKYVPTGTISAIHGGTGTKNLLVVEG